MKSWLTSPTVKRKRIVDLMESTLARTLKETVEFVAGMLAVRDANPAAVAAATETAETFLIEILAKTLIVSGWVLRIRMVNAVSPLSALGAATSTTVAATSARERAAHGIAALVIAVWCAETLTTTAAARARGVDTVIGTVALVIAT